ncbi:hypothetical protein A2331_01455 [Candidatus Falkowbacteria bacterium RIFOXYB2_FULL_34_18]|uniref:Glycosyltransferase subfamily 4-like N-terminal domain-containing protein n=1 Tax=Candidatus Falkowbacteria bacterium RIFOXYD2_FULL_34_120 TaxID=1798007 RepID=A0A1F5TPN6_9BACT|nr:MAG: hypothetical protein A2331_01455 [Candidatus Falkowbacteria bacterium RIFOXYB2_FULL_34_18]OGF29282.1 MAG: hypothetical protein A2500_05335 [Candidatus Falkowbacteria bacterium RIFOXYC12_FULL_34_55]OGF36398.1 MAG: hypothetical protein A2466_00995 [Candidatus Falkowbacteria bacterium RIFOXYC2_FULL_34_220]OGF38877.1 MAG: hypothetical protein A2515_05755 [Candidatus Falkowbacteria bacterium RIFOXYD12_FULL_34_57]OGF40896.1 MAG: hypothetical protein A2531_03980 [Candidatus Falkowbacteria bact
MRVCVINNLYKPYNKGGAEQIVDIILDELSCKHDVFLISTKPFWKKNKKDKKIYYIHSSYYNLEKFPKIFRLFWHFYDTLDVFSCIKIYFILHKTKPDLVLTHNLKGISYLLPALIKILKIRHIHTLHDIQLLHPSGLIYFLHENITNSFWAKAYQCFTRFLFSFTPIVISPSSWLLIEHQKRNFFKNTKSVVMLNPMSKRIYESHRKEDDVFRFVFIGQIENHKGIFLLINAFKNIKNKKSQLIIIGEGTKLKIVEEMTKIYKDIVVMGKKSNEETVKFLTSADCLVLPSLCYENSPTVIYEAFAAGVPVIASNIGGNLGLISNYGGTLFQAGDAVDLVEKMRLAIKNPQKVLGRGRFIQDTNQYMDKLMNLIN